MGGPTKASLDKLQARIDQAREFVSACEHAQFCEQAETHLISAEQSLVQARTSGMDGMQSRSRSEAQLAEVHLRLALRHMHIEAAVIPEKFADTAQEYISLLGGGIVEFKTVIEWKNCRLGPAVKRWFVECVEIHEDALNFLRTGSAESAEFTALGGLLLHAHICYAAEQEHPGEVSLANKCERLRLPGEASTIFNLIKRVNKARQKFLLKPVRSEEKLMKKFSTAFARAEKDLIGTIAAYGDNNRGGLQKLMLALRTSVADLDGFLVEIGRRPDNLDADEDTASPAAEKLREPDNDVTPEEFKQIADELKLLLEDRVDDRELLRLRTFAACQSYSYAYRAFLCADWNRAHRLMDGARSDMEKLEMLFLQAQLFERK
ncbi:MAG: hypothetical protein JSS83_07875 [Cyanobacteria bacterium SZAS LIN-3]|nr:hypothetical protein [Cyanobacteria bacterium SZAS LIN-3]